MSNTWERGSLFHNDQDEVPLYQIYHENSKLFPYWPISTGLSVNTEFEYLTTRSFRQFPGLPKISLPPSPSIDASYEDTAYARRSRRDLEEPISLPELALTLRLGLGPSSVVHNEHRTLSHALRIWASAGGVFPLDFYLLNQRVHDLAAGIYHYNSIADVLEQIKQSPVDHILTDGFFGHEFVASASAVILFSGVFQRTVSKYGERGYRLVLLDAGHASQSTLLAAEASGLSACAVAGYCDDVLNDALRLDGVDESVVHTVALGGRPHQK